jgi:hypothetical protein
MSKPSIEKDSTTATHVIHTVKKIRMGMDRSGLSSLSERQTSGHWGNGPHTLWAMKLVSIDEGRRVIEGDEIRHVSPEQQKQRVGMA